MTTRKSKAARGTETKEARRKRLHDPSLNTVEEQREIQVNNSTLQQNMTAARKQEYENRKREFDGDVINLKRMKDRAAQGYADAARKGYDRTYARLERLGQVLADEFNITVNIPVYDPPIEGANVETRVIKPRSATDRAKDGAYRETKGMGPSGKGGPLPGYPGSDADQAWLNVQGVAT